MSGWDEVKKQRERAGKIASAGKTIGYGCIAIAIAAAIVALISGFKFNSGLIMAIALGAACVILPGAMITAYGVKAASREDEHYLKARAKQASKRPDLQ